MGRGGMNQKKKARYNSCLCDNTQKPIFYAESPSEIGHNFCPVRSKRVSCKGKRRKRHVLTCVSLLDPTSPFVAPEISPTCLIGSRYLAIHQKSPGPTYFILMRVAGEGWCILSNSCPNNTRPGNGGGLLPQPGNHCLKYSPQKRAHAMLRHPSKTHVKSNKFLQFSGEFWEQFLALINYVTVGLPNRNQTVPLHSLEMFLVHTLSFIASLSPLLHARLSIIRFKCKKTIWTGLGTIGWNSVAYIKQVSLCSRNRPFLILLLIDVVFFTHWASFFDILLSRSEDNKASSD